VRFPRIAPPRRALQHIIHDHARDAALFAIGIEAIGWRVPGADDDVHLALAHLMQFLVGGNVANDDTRAGGQRLPQHLRCGARRHTDTHWLRAPRRKRNGHRHRHHNREEEGPEERLGFTDELAEACQRELDERMLGSAARGVSRCGDGVTRHGGVVRSAT
jgi:hypothetical protein